MSSENLNPLDELKSLDQQLQKILDLAGLKPIFYRLDEIAKQHPHDFDVQLMVGDVKQHLVNRGTRIKEIQQAPPAAPVQPPPSPSTTMKRDVPQAKMPELPKGRPSAPSQTLRQNVPQHTVIQSPPSASSPAGPPELPPPGSQKPPPALDTPSLPPDATMVIKIPPQPGPSDATIIGLGAEEALLSGPVSTTERAAPPIPPSMNLTESESAGEASPAPSGSGASKPPANIANLPANVAKPPAGKAGKPPTALPPKPPDSGAKQPVAWRRALLLGALVGSIISIALIALLVNQARKRNLFGGAAPATVQVSITTTPPGAAVSINGEQKCTSDCTVPLAPGNYQITAFLDGYEPAASGVTVDAKQPAAVNLALDPQAQALRVLTDLDQGKVVIDDQPPADLMDGQYLLDRVPAGAHTVKITGRNAEATFSFEVAPAKPPMVTGTVGVKNLAAVLVSSLGNQARVFTNAGPIKLALNGQPQGDAGPAGLDLKGFQPGVHEIVVGEGKDQKNVKENFGAAPTLTAFLKSDLNIGTLIVSTGEDNVQVFLNDKEFRRKTQRGEVRIPAIGKVSVRIAKDGFQPEPVQVAEIKKGGEVRLEFKLRPLPRVAVLQIRGAAAGTEVLIDQKNAGTIGGDGSFTASAVAPGDHAIELRRDQYSTKSFRRTFVAGQTVEIGGSDVVLAIMNATVKLALTPADAAVTYRRDEETQARDLRGTQAELAPGTYVFTVKAPGFNDRAVRFSVAAGETRSVEIKLAARELPPPAAPQLGSMADFENPTQWRKEGDVWIHRGGGFIPYRLPAKGVFTFTVTLVRGGNLFRGGRIRWATQYTDARNYNLFELDRKNFWSKVIEKGKTLERTRAQNNLEDMKAYTVEVDITPERIIHRIQNGGQWVTLDTWAEPGRNFSDGKFGFFIQGNDEIGVSDFKFQPK